MKVGSFFTGYGGLDIAVGGDLQWYAEIEPAACQVLAAHYPDVPNLGDITKIDWATVSCHSRHGQRSHNSWKGLHNEQQIQRRRYDRAAR